MNKRNKMNGEGRDAAAVGGQGRNGGGAHEKREGNINAAGGVVSSDGASTQVPEVLFEPEIDYIIGVDPDVDKNGVGVMNVKTGSVVCVLSLSFMKTVTLIKSFTDDFNCRVLVEAGWLNKGVWHLPPGCSVRRAAEQGRAVGRNHQTGMLLIECLQHYGADVREQKPLPLKIGKKARWRGPGGKITAEEIEALTGWDRRSNQEGRDALLIAYTALREERSRLL